MARLEAQPAPTDPAWTPTDTLRLDVPAASELEPAFTVPTGYTAVLVVTHDCQMDKEANAAYARLRRQKPPVPKTEAIHQAESDPELDRFLTVVPLVGLERIRTDNDRLMSGQTIGYFPLPPSPERGIAECVADLTCPVTIDRNLLVSRTASLTDKARARLRLALGRLYAFRSPEIGFEVESLVGKRIIDIDRDPASPLELILSTDDGNRVRLVLQPQPPAKARPSRRAP